jgi:hypothetical protein
MKVTFFHPRIQFEPIDPLADGLGEEIAREQQEPQAIRLDQSDITDIQRFWTDVEEDLHGGNSVEFSE